MLKKVFMSFVALAAIAAAATGPARAQQTYTVTFAANNNTKTVENVTLPHTFSASYNTANEEFDLILKELYGWSGNPNSLYPATAYDLEVSDGTKVVSTKPDSHTQCLTINNVFEGSVTVNGTYVVDGSEVDYTVAISISAPALYTVTLDDGGVDAGNWSIMPAEAATDGVAEGTEVNISYGGTRKVKSVVATVAPNAPTAVTNALGWDGDLAKVTAESTVEFATAIDGMTITGTLGVDKKVSIADGATVTLDNVTINGTNTSGWAGITCLGDATITLSGTNTVKGFHENYPGIYVPQNKTLTIQGEGSLTASSNGYGAGIGGCYRSSCGNITITGGTVNATCSNRFSAGIGSGMGVSCGTITITGGTVTATGGNGAAGIGSGPSGSCGTITITDGVTSVTATKGANATHSIGAGNSGSCGTVTIAPGANVTQN